MAHRTVVFSVVGWMADYRGPTGDDPAPEGGGRFTRERVGYEAWNFLGVNGNCYAFVTTSSKVGGINLKRVHPESSGAQVDDALLVFLSRVPAESQHPSRRMLPSLIGEGVRVVGWYRECSLFSSGKKIDRAGEQGQFNYEYNARCSASNAFWVPVSERKEVGIDLSGPGGIGRNRVRYPITAGGQYDSYFSDPSTWVGMVLKYIET